MAGRSEAAGVHRGLLRVGLGETLVGPGLHEDRPRVIKLSLCPALAGVGEDRFPIKSLISASNAEALSGAYFDF